MNMKDKKILIIDHGIFTSVATRFMRDCAEVKYYSTWEKAFSDDLSNKIGSGLDGVERVSNPWEYVDKVDMIFVPDTTTAGTVEFLKTHGYPVAGAGSIERIEKERWYGRNVQAKAGLPVQYTEKVIGITALRKFCQEKKNYFVKVDDEFRGVSESFKHKDFKSSEPRIDYIAFMVGPFKEEVVFICEEMLEGVEPGYDAITFDGELLFPMLGGYEKNKGGYVVHAYQDEKELPDAFLRVHQGLASEFKKNKTRFFYSTEMMVGKDRLPFLLDFTGRMGAPGPACIQEEIIENFSEVCYGLAIGEKVNPIMKFKYGASLSMSSDDAAKKFVNYSFPKELSRWVKPIMTCKVKSDYYSVPPFTGICCVVALGNSVKEVVDTVLERVKQVEGNGLECDNGGFAETPEDINKGKSFGINF